MQPKRCLTCGCTLDAGEQIFCYECKKAAALADSKQAAEDAQAELADSKLQCTALSY